MTPRAFEFRPRWWGAMLAMCGCAAGIALGQWQAGRAEMRRATLARIEAAARAPAIDLATRQPDAAMLAMRRVAARGEFLPHFTVLLGLRTHQGRPGYVVVQPMRLAPGNGHVLVARGWIAAEFGRGALPTVSTPPGAQHVEGLALERLPHVLESGSRDACRPGGTPCVWQNLDREGFAQWSGLTIAPLLIEQSNAIGDGLDRNWERAEAAYVKNEMYALQWYSLAALSVALFVALSLRRRAPAVERSGD